MATRRSTSSSLGGDPRAFDSYRQYRIIGSHISPKSPPNSSRNSTLRNLMRPRARNNPERKTFKAAAPDTSIPQTPKPRPKRPSNPTEFRCRIQSGRQPGIEKREDCHSCSAPKHALYRGFLEGFSKASEAASHLACALDTQRGAAGYRM